jgi:hypothetical protein
VVSGRAPIVAALVFLAPAPASAWVITEHEDLTARAATAIGEADPKLGAALQAAWAEAREHEAWSRKRFCRRFAPPKRQEHCMAFAMLPALAADHSCSAPDLLHILAKEAWVDDVVEVANDLRKSIADAKGDPGDLLDVRNDLDLLLQLADTQYADRAEVNTAHYQLARRSQKLVDHLRDALAAGETSNGTALYATYHAAALMEAAAAAEAFTQGRSARERALRAFVIESFAIHFLEDAFAAGHAVGSWGDGAQRKGTHDYYNRYGFEVTTWTGTSYVAHGDIYMTAWDKRAVERGVAASLKQLAEALAPFAGEVDPATAEAARARLEGIARVRPNGDLDACTAAEAQPTIEELAAEPFLAEVWRHTPKPPRRVPSIPRFRLEFGPFVGVSAAGGGSAIWPSDGRPVEGELRGRLGLGGGFSGDGMFSRLMTGRVFGEFLAAGAYNVATHESAAGIGFRFHAPYTFVPGDFIIGLILGFGPPRLAWMLQQAALGGVLRQNSIVSISENVRLQVVAGREAAFVWYFPRNQPGRERNWRFEVTIPAVQLSLLGDFHQEVGSQWTFDLGVELTHERDQPFYAGPYLAGSFYGRYFP